MVKASRIFGEKDSIWFCIEEDCNIMMDEEALRKADRDGNISWGVKTVTGNKLQPLCVNHGLVLYNCPKEESDAILVANREATDLVRSISKEENVSLDGAGVPTPREFLDSISEILH